MKLDIIREIQWNAINLKGGNRFTSRDDNFYKAFFPRTRASGKSNKALQSEVRDRQKLSEPRYVF